MAGDNPINPEIERAVHENEIEEIRQDVQERVEHNRVENRQEMPNAQVGAQGGYPPWGYNQGNHGNAQEESEVVRKLLERIDKLESAKVAAFQQSLPPLIEDPNQYMNHMPQTMEEVNFMGREGYQGQQGNFGQARQYQPQGTYQAQGQSYNQGQFPQGQGRFQNAPQQFPGGGTSYNPNARKHENFSYSNSKAAVQFPPGFDPGAKLPTHEGKATNEDALALILQKMEENGKVVTQQYKGLEAQFAQLSQQVTQMSQQQRTTEFQMGQLATTVGNMQNKGKFPSTTEPNPKEHCKAIELRSGTKYQGPSLPSEDVEEKTTEIEQEAKEDKVSEKEKGEEIAPLSEDEEEKGKMKRDKEEIKKKLEKDESAQPVPKWKRVRGLKEKMSDEIECDAWGIPKVLDRVPFPQRFVKKKLDENFAKFLET
ncbi:hypothetical protein ACS0TY_035596 [Phlomoides rotata]